MSGPGDIPALESGMGMGMGMSLPIGMTRRALSYDDNLEAPMSPPPSDISINNLWRPVIPDRRFQRMAEEDGSGDALTHTASISSAKTHIPVVKAKASSVIMNSLMTKQTQDSMYKFEQKVGLTDTCYTPHKGLTAEETRFHQRMPDSFHKLHMQAVTDTKEDKSTSSAQSTPSGTPQSSPKFKRRSWFNSQGSTASITISDLSVSSSSSVDMGIGDSRGTMERWSLFGPRSAPAAQAPSTDTTAEPASSTTGGFALQSYRGAQKPTPMEIMKAQATRFADDPSQKAPPKIEIPSLEERRQSSRTHKLKPRDMNILTPSGF